MHVPACTTFKAVEAGTCTYLGLFWYVQVPRYVQTVWYVLYIYLSNHIKGKKHRSLAKRGKEQQRRGCHPWLLFLYKGVTLVDNRAHGHYTLAGSPTQRSVLNPLVALTSTTVSIYKI